jgi:hypothetical protein
MASNNKISNLINSQVPFFVRNDHQTFITFIEKYYEFLEQSEGLIDIKDNLLSLKDIDYVTRNGSNATDLELLIQEKLYANYLKAFPKDMVIDKALLLKHAKEFYLTKGSERSVKFLMRVMFGEEDVSFYYPKSDVIRASDGKWYVQKTLRVNPVFIDGVADSSISAFQKFVGRTITGVTSGATAVGESVDKFFSQGSDIAEITLSNIVGSFTNGEQVSAIFNEEGESTLHTITANVYSGVINSITVTNPGARYNVGDHPTIVSGTGTGGDLQIASVSSGNISSVTVIDGGTGFRANDSLLFTISPGASGSGAAGYISLVLNDSSVHPNSYNIYFSTINLEANTAIGNAKYSNLVSAVVDPANNWIQNSLSYFVYANTGPARTVIMTNPGDNYSEIPTISISANTRIRELGILGKMTIINGGANYANGDVINITNIPGGYGTGAVGNVTAVNATGAITQVKFKGIPGHIVGGAGYSSDALPLATVISGSGTGANIAVTSILGDGGTFVSSNSTIGAIQSIEIISGGAGYVTGETTVDLTTLGDGTATATITAVEGVYEYPGRYLNDDGMPSSFNFLQDRDYYQNFSYVIRSPQSIETYRKTIKELAHPAGMKLFGEYLAFSEQVVNANTTNTENAVKGTIKTMTFVKTGNTININYGSAHGLSNGNVVALNFNAAPFGLNTSAGSNTTNGSTTIPGMVLRMAVGQRASYFRDKDLNLYNFLNTGSAANNANAPFSASSYADLSYPGTGVSSADAIAWLSYIGANTTGNTIQDAAAGAIISKMLDIQRSNNIYFNTNLFVGTPTPNSVPSGIYTVSKVNTANYFEVTQARSAVANVRIITPGLGYSNANAFITFSSENGRVANATYTTNSGGSITSVTIRDFGKYYNSRPTANINKSSTVTATLYVDLAFYANNGTGNVEVTIPVT